MKFNKWTLGLAAIGAVSLASAARAEEAKMSTLGTAVSSTVLSGYVDTSIHWNPGTGNANVPNYSFNTPGKADGFNLNSVKLSLAKAEDESEWASGYQFDMLFGPDADTLNTVSTGNGASDFTIEQAYVSLRTPVGNGIDWKLGVFDTVIGYESTADPNNPNYTRSYGYTIEPTTHTGLYGTYKISDLISVGAGVANTFGPTIGGQATGPFGGRSNPPKSESYKTYMGTVSLTAPNSWGFLGGSSLSAGVINGYSAGNTAVRTAVYAGATVNTPITALKAGISWDYENVQSQNYQNAIGSAEAWAEDVALYASYQATEKLSLNGRAEYFWQSEGLVTPNQILPGSAGGRGPSKVLALTGTVQYDLWKNVLSRLEVRWDHAADGGPSYGGNFTSNGLNIQGPDKNNSWLIAANIIYKF